MRRINKIVLSVMAGVLLFGMALAQQPTTHTKPTKVLKPAATAAEAAAVPIQPADLRAQLHSMKTNLARVRTTDKVLKKQLALEAQMLEAMLVELERLQVATPQEMQAVPASENSVAGTDGELEITSVPADAAVYVDGVAIGATPMRMPAASGTREVTLVRPGYFESQTKANVIAGQRTSLHLKLNRLWGEGAFAKYSDTKGMVEVTSNPPGAEIWVAGRRSPKNTPFKFPAPSGTHTVELRLEGYHTLQKQVTVVPDKTVALIETLEPNADTLAKIEKPLH
jgi:hypothetical protein